MTIIWVAIVQRRQPHSECLTGNKRAVAAAASGAGTGEQYSSVDQVLASGVPGTYTLNFPIPCLAISVKGVLTGPALLWVSSRSLRPPPGPWEEPVAAFRPALTVGVGADLWVSGETAHGSRAWLLGSKLPSQSLT